MCTVHAPHWPWSHPFFEPVRCKCSRRQSSSVVRGSIRRSYFLPFTRRVTGIAPSTTGIASFVSGVTADSARERSPFLNEREIFAGSIFQTASRFAAFLWVGVVRPWESPWAFNPASHNNRAIIALGCAQQLSRIRKIYHCYL